jgi:hypothetical protein
VQVANDVRAPSGDELRAAPQPDGNALQGANDLPPSAASPASDASQQSPEPHAAHESKRPGDAKQSAGDNQVAAATAETAPDPAPVSDMAANAAAGAVPPAAPDVPSARQPANNDAAQASNIGAQTDSGIALANLAQPAARQNPEPARLRNGSTNAPERNGSEKNSAADAEDQTQLARTAPPAITANAAPNSPGTAIAPDGGEKPANAPAEHSAKSDAIASAADDTPRSAATLPHAANAEAAPAPNPSQGAAQFAGLLDRAAPDGPPIDAGAPVKISFPTAASAPEAPAGVDALAVRIAVQSAGGDRNFSIRLDPPEFGRVEVDLNVNAQGHAEAELRADRPHTLELLQRDSSALERALKDAGLNLAGGLTFSLKGDGKSGAWRDAQAQARGRSMRIAPVDAARANAAIVGSAALTAHGYGFSTARLDIRV